MYSITWIDGERIQSVTHPSERAIMSLWFAMLAAGKRCRMWSRDKQLIA